MIILYAQISLSILGIVCLGLTACYLGEAIDGKTNRPTADRLFYLVVGIIMANGVFAIIFTNFELNNVRKTKTESQAVGALFTQSEKSNHSRRA